jgi:predicted signal transduction protein with EAL and GGDEF domain
VTFSIGVAAFTSPPASVDVLIQYADQRMYAAKQSGKNAVRHAVIEGDVLVAAAIAAPNQGNEA